MTKNERGAHRCYLDISLHLANLNSSIQQSRLQDALEMHQKVHLDATEMATFTLTTDNVEVWCTFKGFKLKVYLFLNT